MKKVKLGKESIMDGVYVLMVGVGGWMTYYFIGGQPMMYYCMHYYKRVSINL